MYLAVEAPARSPFCLRLFHNFVVFSVVPCNLLLLLLLTDKELDELMKWAEWNRVYHVFLSKRPSCDLWIQSIFTQNLPNAKARHQLLCTSLFNLFDQIASSLWVWHQLSSPMRVLLSLSPSPRKHPLLVTKCFCVKLLAHGPHHALGCIE